MKNNNSQRHGAFGWCELMTTDVQAAKRFYGSLFGWQMEDKNVTGTPYTVVSAHGVGVGGIMAMPAEMSGIPPHWGVYVTVDDVDATARRVEELGGSVCLPPTEIPTVGRICVFRDPQGAPMTVITHLKACG